MITSRPSFLKYMIPALFSALLIAGCGISKNTADKKQAANERDTVETDSLEHRLIVLDPGFESYLSRQPSMDFHSRSFYENRNRIYVQEWNSRYLAGENPDLFETYIEYDPRIEYDMEIEYKLYYYFRFVEEKYQIDLYPGNFQ